MTQVTLSGIIIYVIANKLRLLLLIKRARTLNKHFIIELLVRHPHVAWNRWNRNLFAKFPPASHHLKHQKFSCGRNNVQSEWEISRCRRVRIIIWEWKESDSGGHYLVVIRFTLDIRLNMREVTERVTFLTAWWIPSNIEFGVVIVHLVHFAHRYTKQGADKACLTTGHSVLRFWTYRTTCIGSFVLLYSINHIPAARF